MPLKDISNSRGIAGVTWSADGRHVFVSTNLTGRHNILPTDADRIWPLQLTLLDEVQAGLVASRDGKWLYFRQDNGDDEYFDIYRVPTGGGAVSLAEGQWLVTQVSARGTAVGMATLRWVDCFNNLRLFSAHWANPTGRGWGKH